MLYLSLQTQCWLATEFFRVISLVIAFAATQDNFDLNWLSKPIVNICFHDIKTTAAGMQRRFEQRYRIWKEAYFERPSTMQNFTEIMWVNVKCSVKTIFCNTRLDDYYYILTWQSMSSLALATRKWAVLKNSWIAISTQALVSIFRAVFQDIFAVWNKLENSRPCLITYRCI